MSEISVTLPDGSVRQVRAGSTPADVAAGISPRLAKAAIAAIVDGKPVDLTHPLTDDARVEILTDRGDAAMHVYRHSTAHLLAAAVTNLFPNVQCGIGPATDEGFFYDFVVPRPFVPEDLEAIEKKMKELASQDLPYERQIWPREEAIAFFKKRGEPLKVQLIEEKTAGQPEVSVYTIKDKDTFLDFCVGPHVPSTGRIKAFKLTATSNAYWKGDAKNAPMQRDAIFRIASMTKPVTAVAALMLAEQGKLQLIDPASKYLPEMKTLKVGVEVVDAKGERTLKLEPMRR
jgi:threonyl-tRNA synthetase